MDGFPLVFDHTPEGLLGLVVLLVLFGWLIPRRIYRQKEEEAAAWKAAFETEQEAHAETTRQNGVLLETNELVQAVFTSLQKAVE